MNNFEKAVINSALDLYSGIKGISSNEVTLLKEKVNNILEHQCYVFSIDKFDRTLSSNLTFDYNNNTISNNTVTPTLFATSFETNLKNITIRSFKFITTDNTSLSDYKIELSTNYTSSTPIWSEINKDELNLQIYANTMLKFRVTIPPTKSFTRLYMIFES